MGLSEDTPTERASKQFSSLTSLGRQAVPEWWSPPVERMVKRASGTSARRVYVRLWSIRLVSLDYASTASDQCLQDAITSVIAHPAPKTHLIVTTSADKTLRTWDARTGALVKEHTGHHAPILGASLGLQGSVIVSAGDDGVCLVFTTEVDSGL